MDGKLYKNAKAKILKNPAYLNKGVKESQTAKILLVQRLANLFNQNPSEVKPEDMEVIDAIILGMYMVTCEEMDEGDAIWAFLDKLQVNISYKDEDHTLKVIHKKLD